MKIEIKHWITGSVLVEGDFSSLAALLTDAVEKKRDLKGAYLKGADLTGADLTGAYLTGADLTGADLTGAYLKGAYLKGADLTGAYLKGADLKGADLTGADLTGAYLTGADLTGADLTGAYLKGAYLKGADLTGAYLKGADLTGCDLTPIRDDVWAVLCSSPAEVPALREAIAAGRINGSVYTGPCSCLVGTLAAARHVSADDIPGLRPNASRPAERWFLAISQGDNPENSFHAKMALQWVDEWLGNMRAAAAALVGSTVTSAQP